MLVPAPSERVRSIMIVDDPCTEDRHRLAFLAKDHGGKGELDSRANGKNRTHERISVSGTAAPAVVRAESNGGIPVARFGNWVLSHRGECRIRYHCVDCRNVSGLPHICYATQLRGDRRSIAAMDCIYVSSVKIGLTKSHISTVRFKDGKWRRLNAMATSAESTPEGCCRIDYSPEQRSPFPLVAQFDSLLS